MLKAALGIYATAVEMSVHVLSRLHRRLYFAESGALVLPCIPLRFWRYMIENNTNQGQWPSGWPGILVLLLLCYASGTGRKPSSLCALGRIH
jgi:hypothetical protein